MLDQKFLISGWNAGELVVISKPNASGLGGSPRWLVTSAVTAH
jgi:hypothetical protein